MTLAVVFPGLDSLVRPHEYAPFLRLPEVRSRLDRARQITAAEAGSARYFSALLGDAAPDLYRREVVHLTAAAILAIQLGTLDALLPRLPSVAWCTGYSLGEVARTVFAGAFGFDDALRIALLGTVQGRGVGTLGGSLMLVGRARQPFDRSDRQRIEQLGLSISPQSPRIWNLSGPREAIERLAVVARTRGWRRVPMIDYPVHSPAIAPYAEVVERHFAEFALRVPRVPIFSCQLGEPIEAVASLRAELGHSLTRTYDWPRAAARLVELQGVTQFLDAGPGRTVSRMTRDLGLRVELLVAADLLSSPRRRG